MDSTRHVVTAEERRSLGAHFGCSTCQHPFPVRDLIRLPNVETSGYYCNNCWTVLLRGAAEKQSRGEALNKYYVRTYGITLRQYGETYLRQQGRCVICNKAPKLGGLVVDHDHDSGEVRGLLCSPCNSGIGMLKDDIASLARAIVYLQRPPGAAKEPSAFLGLSDQEAASLRKKFRDEKRAARIRMPKRPA